MKTVLIVDDEETMREMLVEFLSILPNVRFEGCGDGNRAEQLLKQNHYDLVICDFILPGKDGLQLLEYIHREKIGTTVIWVSGNATPRQFRESWAKGVFDFFEKPMDMNVFLASVKKALGQ